MGGSFQSSPGHRIRGAIGLALLGLILGSGPLGARNAPETIRVRASPDSHAYALVQGNHWISTNTSLDELQRLRRLFSGDFLWFRRGARTYLIRDEEQLIRAKGFFDSMRSLDPERADLERRERVLERKEEALEREEEELDRLADRFDDEDGEGESSARSESDRRDLERRQRDLESRMRALEEEQRQVERVERSVEAREDVLEKKAEAELWKLIDRALATGIARPN